jgi:hypothetical protein
MNLTEREKIVQHAAVLAYQKIEDYIVKTVLTNCETNAEQSYFFDNLVNRLNIRCGLAKYTKSVLNPPKKPKLKRQSNKK